MNKRRTRAFTAIEIIVVLAIIAVLALLAVPRFLGYSKQASEIRLAHDAKVLENTSQIYYLKMGDWPRLSDTPYTADEVAAFADKVYDQTGAVIVLDPAGNYYDIDLHKLTPYMTLQQDARNFVLQNPIGSVYFLDPDTNLRLEPTPVTGSVAINNGSAATNTTTVTLLLTHSPNATSVRIRNEAEAFGGWVPVATSLSWVVPAGDGQKTVLIQFKDGIGTQSQEYSATISLDTAGPLVSGLSSSSASATSEILTWQSNEPSTAWVRYGTSPSFGSMHNEATLADSHTVTFSNLASGTLYYYQVVSTDAVGNQATSATQSFTTGGTHLFAPSVSGYQEIVNTMTDTLHVQWDAVSGATKYQVYRNGTLLTTTTALQVVVAASKTAGARYEFWVVATDGTSYSEKSSSVVFQY